MAAHRVALGLRRARGMSTTGGLVPDRAPAAQNGRAAGPAPSAPSAGSSQAAAEVSGHARTGRLRSIRLRLLLPIVVATAGLVVLGVVQTRFAVNTALDARRAQVTAGDAPAAPPPPAPGGAGGGRG